MGSAEFYVYEHWRPDIDQCFYVGKGRGRRAYNLRPRNPYYRAIKAKLKTEGLAIEIRIIAKEMAESSAFSLEVERIEYWRSVGVRLANLTNGGDGVSGLHAEGRALIAAKLKGNKHSAGLKRSEKAKTAISLRMMGNKIWLGRPIAEETKRKLSQIHKGRTPTRVRPVICVDDGRKFPSIIAASRFYGVSDTSINELCAGNKRRKSAGGLRFEYVERLA